jgi:hypothetical protein
LGIAVGNLGGTAAAELRRSWPGDHWDAGKTGQLKRGSWAIDELGHKKTSPFAFEFLSLILETLYLVDGG